ncbi:MAG: class II fructose-1,6-bisphosphate aldolase [Bacilli bacterium]
MLVNAKKMLKNAREGKYAVAQFNINNLEWTKYILEEAQTLKTDIILGVSEGAVKYMGGYNVVFAMVYSLIKDLNINIDVCLHLDHGSTYESCMKAVDAGFTSVMIDASKYSIEDNIKITKKVVEYAHSKGVTVEAEIGRIIGTKDDLYNDKYNASVEECILLTSETGIDFLAPALGSIHGLYNGELNLDFSTMKQLSQKLNIPLVLHGGTGICEGDLEKAIACGICKINFNTELQVAWTKGVKDFMNSNENIYDPRKIISSGEKNIKQIVREKVRILSNK